MTMDLVQAKTVKMFFRGVSIALIVLSLGAAVSCGRWSGRKSDIEPMQTEDRSPRPPDDAIGVGMPVEGVQTPPTKETTPDESPDETERPGNPEGWGPGAHQAVGRAFDPVYFNPQSYELDMSARRVLSRSAQWLRDHPDVWITLDGSADETQAIAWGINLAMARALAVGNFLVGQGLDKRRLFPVARDEPPTTKAKADAMEINRVELLGFMAPPGKDQPSPPPPAEPVPDIEQPEPLPPIK